MVGDGEALTAHYLEPDAGQPFGGSLHACDIDHLRGRVDTEQVDTGTAFRQGQPRFASATRDIQNRCARCKARQACHETGRHRLEQRQELIETAR